VCIKRKVIHLLQTGGSDSGTKHHAYLGTFYLLILMGLWFYQNRKELKGNGSVKGLRRKEGGAELVKCGDQKKSDVMVGLRNAEAEVGNMPPAQTFGK
jgi:hypothetical protein